MSSYFGDVPGNMAKALKGQGGGLQASSTAVGDMITEETQSRGQKQAQAASESLNRMSSGDKRSGDTVGGTGITAQDQVANQQTGSADHLGMAFKK
ncbi:uncharacterized protein SEPMUDRAFT_88748 [Sphaerulina musiva SO2202]|uniref:Uncharacterized protein n=1 Tax=Sphaerulina musiva (strain SO2202) TaxID=692275 RepID=M3D2D7_SPHMS|nr:uncharacterized protein SEPMUDRAFT_88748 [Sphaerulina musiva SO2202]EMF11302.1 hypothetical protein SEPMUDRAFT_88748 [Sphaerulina musiva SO2202]